MENRLLREALKKQKELEKEIEDLKFTNLLYREENDYLQKNYLPKCIIKRKIKELEELLEDELAQITFREEIKYTIRVLNKLLEGK